MALALGVSVGGTGLRPDTIATSVISLLALAVVAWCAALANGSGGGRGWLVAALWLAVLARGTGRLLLGLGSALVCALLLQWRRMLRGLRLAMGGLGMVLGLFAISPRQY